MIVIGSIREPLPAGCLRAALQADGSVWCYMPGDTLPPEPPPGPPPVPQQVTRRQFYRALQQLGWLGATEAAIEATVATFLSSLTDPPREQARIDWNQSTAFLRNNPMLNGLVPLLGKTQADLDALFTLADTFAA